MVTHCQIIPEMPYGIRNTALKELNIKHFMIDGTPPRIILNLADLLENLREHRLERLGLCGLKLESTDSCKLYTHPSLKELALHNVTFPVGTDIFLSRAFPNLKHLKLDNSFHKQEVFTLPYSDLSYLKIINRSATEDSPIMLITLDNNRRRLYNTSTKKAFRNYRMNLKKEMFPPPFVSSKPFDESDTIPTITIICKSVFSFAMRNCEVDPTFEEFRLLYRKKKIQ